MNLRAEEIRSTTFPIARQGYDRELVDAFLEDIALEIHADAETAAAESVFVRVDGDFKSLVQLAAEKADRREAEAEAKVRQMRAEADALLHEARTTAERVRAEAVGIAQQARAEAEKMIETGRRDADARRAGAERDAEAVRLEAQKEADLLVSQAHQRVTQMRVVERSVLDCLRKAGGFVEQATTWLGADENSGADVEVEAEAEAMPEFDEDDLEVMDASELAPSWWANSKRPAAKSTPRRNGSNGVPGAH